MTNNAPSLHQQMCTLNFTSSYKEEQKHWVFCQICIAISYNSGSQLLQHTYIIKQFRKSNQSLSNFVRKASHSSHKVALLVILISAEMVQSFWQMCFLLYVRSLQFLEPPFSLWPLGVAAAPAQERPRTGGRKSRWQQISDLIIEAISLYEIKHRLHFRFKCWLMGKCFRIHLPDFLPYFLGKLIRLIKAKSWMIWIIF